jgi:hypothetical protein
MPRGETRSIASNWTVEKDAAGFEELAATVNVLSLPAATPGVPAGPAGACATWTLVTPLLTPVVTTRVAVRVVVGAVGEAG